MPPSRRSRPFAAVNLTVAQVPRVTLESQVVLVVVTSSLLVARARFGLGGPIVHGCSPRSLRRAHSAPMRNAVVAGWPVEGSGGRHLLVDGLRVGWLGFDSGEGLAGQVGDGGAGAGV